jgi:DNA mismatch repair protein MutS
MNETAKILNTATSRSLVLLDEIGRGTSTFDGMSIAWATVEHILKQNKSKTLFATHYHQLTGLNRISSKIKNYKMTAKRESDTVIFLHKLTPGGCDESYGIDVAKLAGVPSSVIKRAKEILNSLERLEKKFLKEKDKKRQKILFEEEKKKELGVKVTEMIKKINPDHLTPIDGLIYLKKLKDLVDGS